MSLKEIIKQFLDEIQRIAQNQQFEYTQKDHDFFSFIAKHIIFFKYLYKGAQGVYFYKVLISDLYYLILSIIKCEMRYMYVNERSIIENYMRAIMGVSLEYSHITETVFQEMHDKSFQCDFTDAEYSLIKSEYATSCGYIHGGNVLNDNTTATDGLDRGMPIEEVQQFLGHVNINTTMVYAQVSRANLKRDHRRCIV